MAEVVASVESLPDEMLAFIAQFLTVKDLASCCAVGISWREVFGQDIVWRPRCDQTLVSHLATSKPLVEPHFVTPETDDSTLSVIGEWRLNYMRENHLWNNWRQCKFAHINLNFHLEKDPIFLSLFYSNDCILGFCKNKLKLWDLKEAPESHTLHTFRKKYIGTLSLFKVPKSENIVILQEGVVRVWRLDLMLKSFQAVHTFAIEESEKYPDISEKYLVSVIKEKHKEKVKYRKYAVIDNVLVGIIIREQFIKIHFWNVETGQKLKEELLPAIAKNMPSAIRYCDKTKNLLISFFEYESGKVFINCTIYSLPQLSFLPFKQRYIVNNDYNSFCGDIYDKYVAIRAGKTLHIYNYNTSQLVLSVPGTGDVTKFQNLFVYELKMFMDTPSRKFETIVSMANPSIRLVETEFDVAGYGFTRCQVIHNKIVALMEIELHSGMVLIRRCTKEKMLRSGSTSVVSTPLYHIVSDGITVNEAATNVILRGCALNCFAVMSFW